MEGTGIAQCPAPLLSPPRLQAEILESGALPAILALMDAGQTPGCQEAAARAFGNLVCDNMSPQLRTTAGQVGGIF